MSAISHIAERQERAGSVEPPRCRVSEIGAMQWQDDHDPKVIIKDRGRLAAYIASTYDL
jgi:hypothetical protein